MELHKEMMRARKLAHVDEIEWNLKQEAGKKEHEEQVSRAQASFMSACKPAKTKHYIEWLEGYVEGGGSVTHAYKYRWPGGLMAKRDCTITPLYGSSSVTVIVPKGVNVKIEALGHNEVYFMDGFVALGDFVPVYSDM